MRALIPFLFAACTTEPAWQVPAELSGPPAPQTLSLSVNGMLTATGDYILYVSGPMDEGDELRIMFGTQPSGGPCYSGGLCLDVGGLNGQLRGVAEVNAWDSPISDPSILAGLPTEGLFRGRFPANLADGTYYAQAVRVDGANTTVSAVVAFELDHCSSGLVRDEGDVSRLSDCTDLPSLALDATLTGDVELPMLRTVRSIYANGGQSGLTSLSLPALESVQQSIDLDGLPNLSAVSMPLLQEAGVGYSFDLRSPLTQLDLSSLRVTDFRFHLPETLLRVELPAWTTANGTVTLGGQTAELVAPLLTSVDSLEVNASALQTLTLPALRTAGLDVRDNAALATIDLPQLQSANGLVVRDNASLTTLDTPLVTSATGPIELTGNGAWCDPGMVDWTALVPSAIVDGCVP